MRNFKEKLTSFMYGRYGIDQLYYASFVAFFIVTIFNTIIGSSFLNFLVWVILIWMIFRTLSRNIYKRRMENEKFMRIWNPIKAKGSLNIRRIKEMKTHRFRRCPHCKTVLRLPRKSGKHTVKCPTCKQEFKVRVML
ncbi:hypothetical protein PNBC_05885 [Paenibacillus crassostreae]|uniref:Zn-finger containing protein n=1 Tax=Paenibacillus crassostreae TaxID=1763538 RepID=A0A167FUU9_9BACL|nr:hypothetical protein LPB68_18850 [Paenibacillus crassostreae]OAB76924.1 hypothetical protein PNBC_05885 [Paenibacillus crassostreae]